MALCDFGTIGTSLKVCDPSLSQMVKHEFFGMLKVTRLPTKFEFGNNFTDLSLI